MSLTKCYWFDSFAELGAINGADITADGSGLKFEEDDVIFIYDDDGELLIYVCVEYSATETGDPPYVIIGPLYSPTSEYAVFYLLNLAYTSSCMKLAAEVNITCESSPNAQLTCDMLDIIRDERPLLYHDMVKTSENVPSADMYTYLDDTTESDWTEEAGADLDWQSSGVRVGGIPGTGETPVLISQTPNHPPVYYSYQRFYAVGPRLSDEHFIFWDDSSTTIPTMLHVSFDGVVTVVDTAVIPAGATWDISMFQNPGHTFNAVYADKFIVGLNLYTGSKPEQGRLLMWPINADFTFGTGVIIETPTPARYGQIGYMGIGHAVVDDSTYGEDQHIIVLNGVELICMRASDGYSTEHQVIATFPRDSFNRAIAGGRNYFGINFHNGSQYEHSFYYFNGTTWNQVGSSWYNYYYGVEVIRDNGFVVGLSSSSARYYEITPTTINSMGELSGGHDLIYHAYVRESVYGSGVFIGGTYNSSTPTIYVYNVGAGVAPTVGLTIPFSTHLNDYAGELMVSRDSNGYDKILIPNDNFLTYVRGKEGTPYVYTTGTFHISSTVNSRIEIVPGVAEINAASMNVVEPANTIINFAFSLDGGLTWYSWDGVSSNIQLLSLEDVEVNGARYSYFNSSMKAIDVVANPIIDLAFSLDRPATVADNATPIIESFQYNTLDILGTKIHTTQSGSNGINDTRADDSQYDIWLSTIHLINFDDLK